MKKNNLLFRFFANTLIFTLILGCVAPGFAKKDTEKNENLSTEVSLPSVATMSAFLLFPPPPPPQPKPVPPDYINSVKGAQGKSDVTIFSGAATFSYPLWVPEGRRNMTPNISLEYNGNNRRFDSIVGQGWSLPINAIYRSTEYGTNELYNKNHFSADIEGSTQELISVDTTNGVYGAKTEGSFTKFVFSSNTWTATDTKGVVYTFGSGSSTRLEDPNDSSRVFKWMLEKIEDPNGNFITFSYYKDAGQIYPSSIRYTGYDTDDGLYEVRFLRQTRPTYTEYKRGFKTETNHLINKIELYVYETSTPELIYEYDLDYSSVNDAVQYLDSITLKKNTTTLPPTEFDYYDRTNVDDGKAIHLLSKVTYPYGGTQEFTYQPSTAYKETSGGLSNKVPFIIHTVHQVKTQAGTSFPIYTTQYDYKDGYYYYDDNDAYKKEYAGFHEVTVTDHEGNVRKMYFHQGGGSVDGSTSGEYSDHISKKGRMYRTEQYDDSDNLYEVTISKWDKSTLTDDDPDKDRYFVFLDRQTTITYDGDTTKRTKAITYDYDSYGNVTTETDYGEVTLTSQAGDFTDTGQDKIETTTSYALNATNYMYAYPKQDEIQDINSNVIGRTKVYYDSLTFGSVDEGNETKREVLKSTGPDTYITTQVAYNSYGLPTTYTNARNYQTTVTYDSVNLYPDTVTNAKSQVTDFDYNLKFGEVGQLEDPNGAKTINSYDNFGRITEVEVTDSSNVSSELTKSTYTYDMTSTPRSMTEESFTQNSGISILKKTYTDGFGKPIQVRSETEGTDTFIVTNTSYDYRDNVAKQFLPVISTSGVGFETISPTAKNTAFVYDPMNRKQTVTSPLGTTTFSYDDWTQSIEDAEHNDKDLEFDARGNLVTVTEYLDTTTYDTDYTYNPLNQLVAITDAMGNEKETTYDLLGRKLTEEMLHDSSNSTPGSWSFSYDDSGNVTSQTDPKSQTINWTYDELDRVSTEDYTGQVGTEISYTYDGGTYGKGKLTGVTSQGSTDSYTYDILGRVTQEQRTIDSNSYTTSFTYDFLGNPLSVTYPGGTIVANYGYNAAGQLETLKKGTTDVVTDIDYVPTGAIGEITFTNGVVTTNTFDINEAYLLTSKSTVKDTTDLQDLTYTYDNVGNITNIADASDTDGAKNSAFAYDDLYRLTTATITSSANNSDYTRTYTYSIIGNILSKSDQGGTYSYTGDHPQAVSSIGSVDYTYDDNGNLTDDEIWTHTWDYKNQLISSTDGTDTINYTYDHKGKRTIKEDTVATKKTYYVNKYFNKEGTTDKRFFYVGDLKVMTDTDSDQKYHHEDHLTGMSVDTDSSGVLAQLQDYYPFGDVRIDDLVSGEDNDYKFTGKEKDDETGLYYYDARYYNSGIGRFISRDTWQGKLENPQSLNRYSYVTNNPLKYVDPSGNQIALPIPFEFTLAPPAVAPIPWVTPVIVPTDGLVPLQNVQKAETNNPPPGHQPPPPNWDGSSSPGKGWKPPEKEGGNWYNPKTGQSLRKDFNNPAHKPHYDSHFNPKGNSIEAPKSAARYYPDTQTWETKGMLSNLVESLKNLFKFEKNTVNDNNQINKQESTSNGDDTENDDGE